MVENKGIEYQGHTFERMHINRGERDKEVQAFRAREENIAHTRRRAVTLTHRPHGRLCVVSFPFLHEAVLITCLKFSMHTSSKQRCDNVVLSYHVGTTFYTVDFKKAS